MALFRGKNSARQPGRQPDRLTPWDNAVEALNAQTAELDKVTDPGGRARVYELIARANEAVARVVDEDLVPALDPHEGTTYKQAYADSARLARILAEGERRFGRYRPGSVQLTGVPRAHRPTWERYLGSTDRMERCEILIDLAAVTEVTCGTNGACMLNTAYWSERKLGTHGGQR